MSIENTQAESHDPKQEGDGSVSGLTGSEASPRPWKQWSNSPVDVLDAKGNYVATAEMERDAAHIVQAVNAYDSLRTALRKLDAACQDLGRAALPVWDYNPPAYLKKEWEALADVLANLPALSQVPDSRGGK